MRGRRRPVAASPPARWRQRPHLTRRANGGRAPRAAGGDRGDARAVDGIRTADAGARVGALDARDRSGRARQALPAVGRAAANLGESRGPDPRGAGGRAPIRGGGSGFVRPRRDDRHGRLSRRSHALRGARARVGAAVAGRWRGGGGERFGAGARVGRRVDARPRVAVGRRAALARGRGGELAPARRPGRIRPGWRFGSGRSFRALDFGCVVEARARMSLRSPVP